MRLFILAGIAAFFVIAGIARAASFDVSRREIEVAVSLDDVFDKDVSYIIFDLSQSYELSAGENITIPFAVYRGATLKRTLYIWIEDKNGTRVSSKSKHSLPARFTSYNLSAELNFSGCRDSGAYRIVAEGLDLNLTKDVSLEFIGCGQEVAMEDGKMSFNVLSSPSSVISGESFTTRIVISNPTEENIEFDVWSYVYRSSVCYSGEREQNRKTINVPEFSNVTFDLENTAIAPAGDYNLKIKLLRSDRKTPVELTLPVEVRSNDSSDTHDDSEGKNKELLIKNDDLPLQNNVSNSTLTKRKLLSFLDPEKNESGVVYESSSAKARRLTVYFIIAALALVLVALILKKL
ncbi:hypothetical protein KY359_00180 [Candidatus Woesearchaeota archaeon]|nr:hypothetical protein [Candidatus Woesearchaeota archaeon]